MPMHRARFDRNRSLGGGGGGGWAGVPSSRGLKWENKTYKLKRSISVRSIKLPFASAIFFL